MPNRVLYESICTSETLAGISAAAERLFCRLIVNADDFGRFDARPQVIRTRCFSAHPVLDLDCVREWLGELANADLIRRYSVGDKPYLYITNWRKYQRVRAAKSKWPDPPADICEQPPTIDGNRQQMPPYTGTGTETGTTTESESGTEEVVLQESPEEEPEIVEVSEHERLILKELRDIAGSAFKYKPYLEQIRQLSIDYPTVNLLDEVKKLKAWLAGATTKNPLLRFRNWCNKAAERSPKQPAGKGGASNGIDFGRFQYSGE